MAAQLRAWEWSEAELDRLRHLYAMGYSVITIAGRMKRGERSVQHKIRQLGLSLQRRPNVYTPHSVHERFLRGARHAQVVRWIQDGALEARRVPWPGRGTHGWRVQHEALLAFLENESYWMEWDPHELLDSEIRLWATGLRDVPWRWLTSQEASDKLCYTRGMIGYLIRSGTLEGVWRQGRWWLRSDHVEDMAEHPERFPGPGPRPKEAA